MKNKVHSFPMDTVEVYSARMAQMLTLKCDKIIEWATPDSAIISVQLYRDEVQVAAVFEVIAWKLKGNPAT